MAELGAARVRLVSGDSLSAALETRVRLVPGDSLSATLETRRAIYPRNAMGMCRECLLRRLGCRCCPCRQAATTYATNGAT